MKKKHLLYLLAALTFTACSEEEKVKQAPPAPFPVAKLKPQRVPISNLSIGTIDGLTNVELRAKVEGYIEEIFTDEGRFLQKGDPIFKIEDDIYQNEVLTAEAALARSKAKLEKSRADVERLTPLAEQNAVSKQELDYAIAEHKEDQANVKASEASLAQAQINLGYTEIHSPINGVLGQLPIKVGSLVGRGESTLLSTVSEVDEVYVYFNVDEASYLTFLKYVPGKSLDDKIEKVPPMEVILADNSVFEHKAELQSVDRAVNVTTGSIRFRAIIENPDGLLRPGNFVRLNMTHYIDSAVIVPKRRFTKFKAGNSSLP
ncbi:efflux RND transporter periplasmic adaptor subunit [bacterium SCSIO 12741]|nr:efflux RND transporter periplasmic adaptor subunit [bacterium SCSIO 12741]